MKTFYKLIVYMTILVIVSVSTIFVLNTNTLNYCKDYFEVKRLKLKLAKPEKVDSLLNVITFQDSIIQNYYGNLEENYMMIVNQKNQNIQELENERKKLIDIINLQTKTINDLQQHINEIWVL